MNSILKELGINDINHGACTGKNNWFSNTNAKQLKSYNPSNGELIATVSMADEFDYDKVVKTSKKAFSDFRKVPSPIRGELVRQMGEALREMKDPLGSLVSLEMGKIYNFLGLTSGYINNDQDDHQRKENYNCDITYATNSELGFDYLSDNMK